MVLRGLLFPFFVMYAAFAQERTVFILNTGVFSGHPFEGA
jgi:hypothetical protein